MVVPQPGDSPDNPITSGSQPQQPVARVVGLPPYPDTHYGDQAIQVEGSGGGPIPQVIPNTPIQKHTSPSVVGKECYPPADAHMPCIVDDSHVRMFWYDCNMVEHSADVIAYWDASHSSFYADGRNYGFGIPAINGTGIGACH
jgi:hypothetical protein